MSYESYEPYDEYEQPQHQDQQSYEQYYEYEPQQYEPQQYEPQQYEQPYEGGPRYQEPQQFQDQQWAQSGLGWEQRAWDDARLGVSPLQERDYGQSYQYTQVNELSGTDFQQYQAELPQELPVPDYPPEYEPYEQYTQYAEHSEYATETAQAAAFPRQRADEPEPPASREPEAGPATASPAKPSAAPSTASSAASSAAGRGSFGAAGIGAVTAVAAIASSGALLVVVALIQAAVAIGWQQAMGSRDGGRVDRRAAGLATLIGWAATAAAFRLSPDSSSTAIPAALGLGFVLLAADQISRRGRTFGDGESVAGLGISVAGTLFAVLPAGFVTAERTDSALTGACASAAALGVLCCALLGRNPVRGIVAALAFGAGVGAYAAKALQADGGMQAGALGGAIAALAAAAAVGVLDRIVAEAEARGSTRIVSQALPVALAAVGALISSAVFR
jgi:hypothetical protein